MSIQARPALSKQSEDMASSMYACYFQDLWTTRRLRIPQDYPLIRVTFPFSILMSSQNTLRGSISAVRLVSKIHHHQASIPFNQEVMVLRYSFQDSIESASSEKTSFRASFLSVAQTVGGYMYLTAGSVSLCEWKRGMEWNFFLLFLTSYNEFVYLYIYILGVLASLL